MAVQCAPAKPPDSSASDWARGKGLLLIWCLPLAGLAISDLAGGQLQVVAWPVLLTWMGAACLLNARGCRRLHCFLTGPFFLLLALVSLLYGLGALPLGSHGWRALSLVLIVGGLFLYYVPEWLFGRYLPRRSQDCV